MNHWELPGSPPGPGVQLGIPLIHMLTVLKLLSR